MKPVKKGGSPRAYAAYKSAKADLIAALGAQCSYCEAAKDPQDLHVEHIYPKDPHPERALLWENFLLSCSSCNSYKSQHLGNRRRRGLETRYVWPHLDNTFRVFKYSSDGRVELRARLREHITKAANFTIDMFGFMLSPQKAKSYSKKGIAFDGVSKRKEQWAQVTQFRVMYLGNPTMSNAVTISNAAAKMGYFSIWMEVFKDRAEVRKELIRAFKADPDCFDGGTCPVKRGRI
ncbi:MAG: HNH endonuclease [Planctomycetaceae bacterium]|nr:HNH endonuclease [Planctomycetaceae bacterium]